MELTCTFLKHLVYPTINERTIEQAHIPHAPSYLDIATHNGWVPTKWMIKGTLLKS